MFAIIKTGGKQYKVAANDVIKVEKLVGTPGEVIEFGDVLMIGKGATVKVGAPLVSEAKVYGTVLDQIRDDKVIIFKKNRRHNYRRKNGHRQYLTVVRITDVLEKGMKAQPKKVEQEKPVEKQVLKVAPKSEKPMAKTASKTVSKSEQTVKKAAPKAVSKEEKPVKKVAPKAKTESKK